MQYLLLIYDNEKRWSEGYDESELGKYVAFGKEFASAIKGGNALQPTATTVRVMEQQARDHRRAVRRKQGAARRFWWRRATTTRRWR